MRAIRATLFWGGVLAFILVSTRATAKEVDNGFFASLSTLCGSTFVGKMTYPADGQDSFAGKSLVAEFNSCSQNEIRVAFRVGEDHSRTWVFTQGGDGLSLKHDHRHADGTPDEITNYGGFATADGTSHSQSFPADSFTQSLIPEASTNIWTITLSDDQSTLTYHLTRHQEPRFTAVLERVQN